MNAWIGRNRGVSLREERGKWEAGKKKGGFGKYATKEVSDRVWIACVQIGFKL